MPRPAAWAETTSVAINARQMVMEGMVVAGTVMLLLLLLLLQGCHKWFGTLKGQVELD